MEKVERYIGKITWLEGDIMKFNNGGDHIIAEIIRGIKGEDYFNVEYGKNDEDEGGLVKLKTNNGIDYAGASYSGSEKEKIADISTKFYFNSNKAILIGKWIEDTWEYTSIFNLERVEKF